MAGIAAACHVAATAGHRGQPPAARPALAAAKRRSDADSLEGLAAAVRGFKGGRGSGFPKRSGAGGGGRGRPAGRGKPGTKAAPPPPPPPSSRGFSGPSRTRKGRGASSDEEEPSTQDSPLFSDPWSSEDDYGTSTASLVALEELTDDEVAELIGADTAGADALAGADPVVEAALEAALSQFAFPLDAFQVKSVRHILSGRSVVVCAPTGAGKTAIAEAAALHLLASGGRVIYTTPLKALSNQKLGEMRGRFGVDAAGLQTGDASINPDGSIVVMTTEILRNMLYRTEDDSGGPAEDRLAGVKLVVFDECHYLGDPGRGSVWEECIINLPKDILILAMSATVRNPADLAGWISAVHGECDLVQTTFRPVPLTWQYCLTPGGIDGDGKAKMLPLLNSQGRAINPALLPPAARMAAAAAAAAEDDEEGWGRIDDKESKKMRNRTLGELLQGMGMDGEALSKSEDDWHRLPRWQRIPSMEAVVSLLASRTMLPAIWFIFSRKECDGSVARLASGGMSLTTDAERAEILAEVEALRADQAEAVKTEAVPALAAGLASHHAGCLPGWKGLVERLFQRGLVKVVFATETLAAGINMPAKTTLVSALSRRRDDGIALLTHNELLQMAGRAGRRGYDTQGHCVIVQSRWEDPEVAYDIIRRGPEPLRSQFTTNYGMALNLLWTRGMSEAREFLDRSYARHLSGAGAARAEAEVAALEAKAARLLGEAGGEEGASGGWEGDLWGRYQKLQGRKREEKRAAKALRAQLSAERGAAAEAALADLGLPRAVGLDLSASNIDDSGYFLPALVISRVGDTDSGSGSGNSNSEPELAQYLCLGADNMLYVVRSRHICALSETHGGEAAETAAATAAEHATAGLRRLGAWAEIGTGASVAEGSALTAGFAARLPAPQELTPLLPSPDGMAALAEQRARVKAVKVEMDTMKADKRFARASKRYARAAAKAEVLLERAATLREELEGRMDGGWRKFEAVVGVLEAAGAFTSQNSSIGSTGGEERSGRWHFTPLGLVAREIRSSNELWLATALTHAALQTLKPPQLAAVVAALVAPDAIGSRPKAQAAYPPSAEVVAAVEALEPARAELAALQLRAGLEAPVGVDLRLTGVVEAWASGVSWTDVTADCGLDDGDVARLLMRTVDCLRQAAHCEHLLRGLRTVARQAAGAMDRKPISDLVA